MNIIEYKLNEGRLDKLIVMATSRCNNEQIRIGMNEETRNILIAQTKNISAFIRHSKQIEYYCGVQILVDNSLELGEIKFYTEVLL